MNQRARLGSFAKEIRQLPRMLRLLHDATGGWTPVWATLLLIEGVLPAAVLQLTKRVVDALVPAIDSRAGWSGIETVWEPALGLGLALLAGLVARAAAGWVEELQTGRLEDHISHLIHEKSARVRMAFYDDPEFHDHLHRARDEARYRPARLLGSVGVFLRSGVTLCAVATVLVPEGGWLLPVVLLLSTVPSLWSVMTSSWRRRAWQRQVTPLRRRAAYLTHVLTARETAAEGRMLQLTTPLSAAYKEIWRGLRIARLNLVQRESLREIGARVSGLTVAAGAALWVVNQALAGRVTPGALVMFGAACVQGQAAMRAVVTSAGQLVSNSLFLEDLFEFLDLETEETAAADRPAPFLPRRRLVEGVRFEGVGFRYSGSSREALDGLTFTVPAGATVAIVGPNGAGKSTVFKLLCRFYEPQRGQILVDGQNIADHTPSEVRRAISVLLQEPVRYSATVAESVVLGGIGASSSLSRVRAAVIAAGAEGIVARLPSGYDTLLGKEFDNGAELSGGEWQRIALARALLRPAPLLLLDEPTSAMDSWAEVEWFSRLRDATAGRTTIVITHRFTTAMRADVIYVMNAGRIVESGRHEALVAAGGGYARSWAEQTHHAAQARAA